MTSFNSITQKGKFDAGHRIMNERFKCFNIHGHEFHYEMTFGYDEVLDLGYAIDFNEIKRIAGQWIMDTFDHAFIANPKDEIMLAACREIPSKKYVMNRIDLSGDCNPSSENIAKEIFFAVSTLLNNQNIRLTKFVLYESSNCYATCTGLIDKEWNQLKNIKEFYEGLLRYKEDRGRLEYDRRKV